MGRMGPKISSCIKASSSATSTTTVGAEKTAERRDTLDLGGGRGESENLWLTDVFVFLVALSSYDHFAVRPFQEFHQSAPVSRWHNAAEVGALLRVLGVKLLQRLLQRRQHGIPSGRRAEHVVRSHAALTSVEEFGPNQTVDSGPDVHAAKYHARTLATQLQGHWGQVNGGRLHDDTCHLLGA